MQPRGYKAPLNVVELAEFDKFFELPEVKSTIVRSEKNIAILRKWLTDRKVQVFEQTLVTAFFYTKDFLDTLPPPAPKPRPKNIGIDFGNPPSGRVNHAHPPEQTPDENRISAATAFKAFGKHLKEVRERREKELAEVDQTLVIKRAKVPPRIG